MKKATVFKIDYFELESVITDFLKQKGVGGRYSIVAAEELGNDTSVDYDIKPEVPDEYDREAIMNGENWRTQTIMCWMCAEGKLEAGEYIIDIFW